MKKYVFEEYRDNRGNGSEKVFETEEMAVNYAKEYWNNLCNSDKQSYIDDVAPIFRVYEVELTETEFEACQGGHAEHSLNEYLSADIWEMEW